MQLEKIIDGSLDLVLGGGSAYYERRDNEELLAKAACVTYTQSWDEA